MVREQRMRYAGLFFYIVVILSLFVSARGHTHLKDIINSTAAFKDILFPLVSLAIIVFTSESVGYLFNSIFVFIWNLRGSIRPEYGGYAAEWNSLNYDYKQIVLDKCGKKEEDRLTKYGADVFFSYFWNQFPERAVEWVSRRHSAFFINMSTVVSIITGVIFAFIIIEAKSMGHSRENWIVYFGSLLFAAIFVYNALGPKREAFQMIDFLSRNLFDDEFSNNLNSIQNSTSNISTEAKASPLYRIFRNSDLREKINVNDKRKYYFDSEVDIVRTTISKTHIEPKHLHQENIEIYLIEYGNMNLIVDDKTIPMVEGDMVIVYPNAVHAFETTESEVRFLAIKKYPGLMDKVAC